MPRPNADLEVTFGSGVRFAGRNDRRCYAATAISFRNYHILNLW